jgi:hypothetical protein
LSTADQPDDRSAEQVRTDILVRRDELAKTVDALRYKLDVKARASERLSPYKAHAAAAVAVVVGLIVWRRVRR